MGQAANTIPAEVGKYQIIRQIGEGATSIVYLCSNENQNYALKLMRPMAKEAAIEAALRFRQEAAAMARLSHPGIVKVFELGDFDGLPFVVMEFLEGKRLDELLIEPMPEAAAISLAIAIADILKEVHRHGIIHRDIKPENILQDANGAFRLIDFGFVGQVDHGRSAASVGTLDYASPEQFGVIQAIVDARSDLYSLGAVLYRAVTRVLPYQAEDLTAKIEKIKNCDLVEPRKLNPGGSFAFAELLKKLLAVDPSHRYQSAHGLKYDLENISTIEDTIRAGRPAQLGAQDHTLSRFGSTPLFGRETETEVLNTVFRDSNIGKGKCVIVDGEPGSGKSYLVKKFLGDSVDQGRALLMSAKCQEADKIPLGPLHEAIDSYIGQLLRLPPQKKSAALKNLRQAASQTEFLICRFSKTAADVLAVTEQEKQLSQGVTPDRYFAVISQFFCALGQPDHPLVLYIDDMQWVDEASFQVLTHVLSRIATSHIMLLMTSRNDSLSEKVWRKFIGEGREEFCRRLPLRPLDFENIEKLIASHLGGSGLSHANVTKLQTRTNGNPFAIGQYLRALMDSGILQVADGQWQVKEEQFDKMILSSDVVELIVGRLATLSASALPVMQIAAVIGQEFEADLLSKVSGLGLFEVTHTIMEAIQANLVERLNESHFTFVHDRVRESLIQKNSEENRRELHQKIAETLDEGDSKSTETIYAIASHYSMGFIERRPLRVYEIQVEAGFFAMGNFANEETVSLLSRALNVKNGFPEIAYPKIDLVYEALGQAFGRIGRSEESLRHLELALSFNSDPLFIARIRSHRCIICVNENRGDLGWIEADLGLQGLGVSTYKSFWGSWLSTGWNWTTLFILKLTGFGFGRSDGDDFTRRKALIGLYVNGCFTTYINFQWRLTSQLIPKMLIQMHHVGDRPDIVDALAFFCLYVGSLGFKKTSTKAAQRAIRIAEGASDKRLLALAHYNYGLARHWSGEPADAQSIQTDFLDTHSKWLLPRRFVAMSNDLVANNLLTRGHSSKALERAKRAVERAEKTVSPSMIAVTSAIASMCYSVTGRTDEAAACLTRAQTELSKIPQARVDWCWIYASTLLNSLEGTPIAGESESISKYFQISPPPLTAPGFFKTFYLYNAYYQLREYQNSKASLSQLKSGLRLLYRASWFAPHWRCHYWIIRASMSLTESRFRACALQLVKAENLALQGDSAWGLFMIEKTRAQLFDKKNDSPKVKQHAAAAHRIATEYGWGPRLAALEAQFQFLKPEKETIPSPESETPKSKTATRQLEALIQLSSVVSSVINADEQIKLILDETTRLMDAERAFLFLDDAATEQLKFVGGRDRQSNSLANPTSYSSTVIRKVHSSKDALVVTGTDEGELLGSQSAVIHDLRSIMAAPILVKEAVIGVIYLDSRVAKGLFTREDIDVLRALASLMGTAISGARAAQVQSERMALQKELEVTAVVQSFFLPESNEFDDPRFSLAAFYRPATQCGGDWWWFKRLSDNQSLMIIADVMGHGAGSAMITAAVASIVHVESRSADFNIEKLLVTLNEAIFSITKGKYFVSMIVMLADLTDMKALFWDVGTPLVARINKEGKVKPIFYSSALIGMSADITPAPTQVDISPGDRLFLYTDGISEQILANGAEFGVRRIHSSLSKLATLPPKEMATEFVRQYDKERGKVEQSDDLTFIVFDVKA